MKFSAAWLALPALALALAACGGGEYQPPVNVAPVAKVGPAQTLDAGSKVTLDGVGTDANSDLLNYVWTLTKPAGSNATLLNPKVTNPVFIVDVAGSYTATLVVDDGKLYSAPQTINLTVVVPTASFTKLWDGDQCSTRRRVVLIDQRLVYTESHSNSCSDSDNYGLYDSTLAVRLCTAGGVSGALSCTNNTALELMKTILANPAKADLGLGGAHTVQQTYAVGF
ncbi:PKD domain-containing protein [Rugamonas sp. DEMB1]|uniref:PKD domain-containing protein n=1 Tax=Rugamonas sp. DEMB1 TaxID=3039386 RepID=UPI0024494782|nr:PKD domain-containing protein [Rugamonas sp. DEMB1]WGG51506.1 PKD domain-containing protein [Rugamonas sp. DEMB1]